MKSSVANIRARLFKLARVAETNLITQPDVVSGCQSEKISLLFVTMKASRYIAYH